MQLKMGVMAMMAIGLLLLSACSSGNQAIAPANSPAAPAETQPSTVASLAAKAGVWRKAWWARRAGD